MRNVPLGAALADEFTRGPASGDLPDHAVVLMQSHGFTTCAASIKVAVFQAVYSQLNAQAEAGALSLGHGSKADMVYLTPRQAADSWATNIGTVQRPWDLWVRQVRVSSLYTNALDA